MRAFTHTHTQSCALTNFLLLNCSFAAAEIQDCFNFSAASKVHAGRVIGRCHAALGEHALSEALTIELARRGRFLLSEADASFYCVFAPSSCLGLEFESLHSFGKGFVALFGSWQCTDPSECESSFESAAWAAWRAYFGV